MTFTASVVRVENERGQVRGTGALISERHVVTCAHVIENLRHIQISFLDDRARKFRSSGVEKLNAAPGRDVAVLALEDVIADRRPLSFGDSTPSSSFLAVGFPELERGVREGDADWDQMAGEILAESHRGMIRIEPRGESPARQGMSGGPVWVEAQAAAVGLIAAGEGGTVVYMIPTRVLAEEWPALPRIEAVQRQSPHDFTVQILDGENRIVGNGVAASKRVLTCLQALHAAAPEPRVWFPEPSSRESDGLARRVEIDHVVEGEEDVAILRVVDGEWPWPPEKTAQLGEASAPRDFLCVGYTDHGIIGGRLRENKGRIQQFLQKRPGLLQLDAAGISGGPLGAGVLDLERNLVVGLVGRELYSTLPAEDRDDDLAIAIDARILGSIADGPVQLRSAPLPLSRLRRPRLVNAESLGDAARRPVEPLLHGAPDPSEEWVGHEELLDTLDREREDPAVRAVVLGGPAGFGKSSLARHWFDQQRQQAEELDASIWWTFRSPADIDPFFDKVLQHLVDEVALGRLSVETRVEVLGHLLESRRILLVLDGLDYLQRPGHEARVGDPLGRFYELLASPRHRSFALLISRRPRLDLLRYATFRHRDLAPLETAQGIRLLRRLGVRGEDQDLASIVEACRGEALSLALWSAYVTETNAGDEPPELTGSENHLEIVLEHLHEAVGPDEHALLVLLAAMRSREPAKTVRKLLGRLAKKGSFGKSAVKRLGKQLSREGFDALVDRLARLRLLHVGGEGLGLREVVRDYYLEQLAADPKLEDRLRRQLIWSYKEGFRNLEQPTLQQLRPAIEVIHHECRRDNGGGAFAWYRDRIRRAPRFPLTNQLGAWTTNLEILREFFPQGELEQPPLQMPVEFEQWLYQELGVTLVELGRPQEAAGAIGRSLEVARGLRNREHRNRSRAFDLRRRAGVFCLTGPLTRAVADACEALELEEKSGGGAGQVASLVSLGWALHLQGDAPEAGRLFDRAEQLERELPRRLVKSVHLSRNKGVLHAEHLATVGEPERARRIIEENLGFAGQQGWPAVVSDCRRLLGVLELAGGRGRNAAAHHDAAVAAARSTTSRTTLLRALLGRGRWRAEGDFPLLAEDDLAEALDVAVGSGFAVPELDVRTALARVDLRLGRFEKAAQRLDYVRGRSLRLGYGLGLIEPGELSEGGS